MHIVADNLCFFRGYLLIITFLKNTKILIINALNNFIYMEKDNKFLFFTAYKRKIIYFSIFFLICFIVWFLLNFSVNLLLNSSPTIKIEPDKMYINLTNNESFVINYSIYIDKPFYVDIECNYSFVDISDGVVLDSSVIDLKKSPFSVKQNVYAGLYGSGKKIYNMQVLCNDLSDENKTYQKTSFLLLSYELTAFEKKMKEEIRPKLLLLFESFNNISLESKLNNRILANNNKWFDNIFFSESLTDIDDEMKIKYSYLKVLEGFWKNERYSFFSGYNLENDIYDLNELMNKYEIFYSKMAQNMQKQNEYVQGYNKLVDDYNVLYSKSLLFDKTMIFEDELLPSLSQVNKLFIDIFKRYNGSLYLSVDDFSKEVIILESLMDKYSFLLNETESAFYKDSLQIIKKENDLRCVFGNCKLDNEKLNIINVSDFCNLFDSIVSSDDLNLNYTFDSLSKKYGMIFYNNSYYIIDGANVSFFCVVNSSECNQIPKDEKILFLDSLRHVLNKESISITLDNDSKKFYQKLCGNNFSLNFNDLKNLTFITFDFNLSRNLDDIELKYKLDSKVTYNMPKCCLGGICADCCIDDTCRNDEKTYPLLFIHGHSFVKSTPAEPSLSSFDMISYKLMEDGFIDAGVLSFTNLTMSDSNLAFLNAPISVKASYYYDSFYSFGSYVYITKKNDNIDTYAIRLSEIINALKSNTKRPKVNVVAHSMGGLVVRRYMQIFGTDSIDKVILIGTPNHGVSGRVKYLCSVVGEKLECDDMADNSILIAKLNDPNYVLEGVKLYTISGTGCSMSDGVLGDGVVTINSSMLEYAVKNYVVNGSCTDLFATNLHNDLIDTCKYPQVYEYLKGILLSDIS